MGKPSGLAQQFDRFGHGRPALANQHIDTPHALANLVDDGILRQCALARTVVSDDELALATADGQQRIDDGVPGVQGTRYRLPSDNGR